MILYELTEYDKQNIITHIKDNDIEGLLYYLDDLIGTAKKDSYDCGYNDCLEYELDLEGDD